MKFAPTKERALLLLFIIYVLDLIWKLFNWRSFTQGMTWLELALPLTIRFLVMGGLLYFYLRFRKTAPKNPSNPVK
jgi:hypothetical protein